MQKRWLFKNPADEAIVRSLQQSLNINETLATLLVQRGVSDFDKAKNFFRPSLSMLHDPFLMKDMEKAVNRLNKAIQDNERVLVYGDYDVDGTTAVATFYGFLSQFHENLEFYIPDRYTEGYGVSKRGIQWAIDHKCDLIVTLDCGIKASERVKDAKQAGIDVIICDHHLPEKELPDALAILDPKRPDCDYPYKELSGCGVGFKLLQAYSISEGISIKQLYEYLDLVAVSIASDIVPINGENRVMAYFGLQKLNTNPRHGLKALMSLHKSNKEMTISGIVFSIGPRINASGRIAHAKAAVELLIAGTPEEANKRAGQIDIKNEARRSFDSAITQEAIDMIASDKKLENAKSTVLYKEGWHKGVIGIVASRCIEKYHRPTIIMTASDDKVTGSARSVPGFDVYEAITECADLLDQYGGHMYAAGITMPVDNVPAFQERFEKIVSDNILEEQLIPAIEIDTVIFLDEVNYKFYNIMKQMGPFGPENMQPVFVSENVHATNVRVLKGEHLKFFAKQEGTHVSVEAIGFGLGQYYEMISSGMRFHMAYTVQENDFRDQKSLQIQVKDIKFD